MKKFYPIQNLDSRYQVVHINPKIIQRYEKNGGAIIEARLFVILISQRQIKMISTGDKLTTVEIN